MFLFSLWEILPRLFYAECKKMPQGRSSVFSGNPGRAVTFFDPGTDGAMSTDLVKVLSDAGQNVPSFLGGENGGGMSSVSEKFR